MGRAFLRVLVSVGMVSLCACPALTSVPIPCRTNANCPSGSACNADGVCEKGIPGSSGEVLAVNPSTSNVAIGATQQFTATVDGAPAEVTWTIEGPGSMSGDTYTAPLTLGDEKPVVVRATRVAEPQISGTALVFVVAKNPAPKITSLSPMTATAGASSLTLTITGSDFVGDSVVMFDDATLTPSSATATQLVVSVPAASLASAGARAVKVVTPAPGGGTSEVLSVSLESPVPSLVSATPAVFVVGEAATIDVVGSGFTTDTTLSLASVPLNIASRTSTTLSAAVPASALAAAGPVDLTVRNPAPAGGSASLSLSIVNPAPELISVSPSAASAGSGDLAVTLTGAGFTSTTVIKKDGATLLTTFASTASIQAVIPAAALATPGSVQLIASTPTPGGGDSAAVTLTVTNPAPTLVSLSRTNATAGSAGFTLTATGSGFLSSSVIRFGATDLVTTFVSGTQLSATVAATRLATAAVTPVTVFTPTPGGGVSEAISFTVNNPAPTLTAIAPNTAPVGSASVTITATGTGFIQGSQLYVGPSSLVTTFVSSTSLTAALPATLMATSGLLSVTVQSATPGGGTSAAQTFSVTNPAAQLSTISPQSASAGSAAVSLQIDGTGFVSTSVPRFGTTVLATTSITSTRIMATIPSSALAASGVFAVTVSNPTPGGGGTGSQQFRVDRIIRNDIGSSAVGTPFATAGLNRTTQLTKHPITGEYYFSQDSRASIWRVNSAGNIVVFAGTGVAGMTDNLPATQAQLNSPRSGIFDAAGNYYFADYGNHRIRKIDTAGFITTLAGNGSCNATGDSGLGTAATVGDLGDVKLYNGSLYWTQCGCNGGRVRKLDLTSNIITTVAGNGTQTHAGEAIAATAASMSCPMAIAFDSVGQLFIADWGSHRIRKVDTGGIITTIAGNGSSSTTTDNVAPLTTTIANPRGLTFDAQGNLLISSFWGYRIRKLDLVGNLLTTFAGTTSGAVTDNVSASSARIGHPAQLFFDGGELYFMTLQDSGSDVNALMKVNAMGNVVQLSGKHLPTTKDNVHLYGPFGIAVDSVGNRYVGDRNNDRIYRVDVNGALTVFAGNGMRGAGGDSGPATQAQFLAPEGLWLDAQGNLFIADFGNAKIRRVDTTGIITTVAGGGTTPSGCPGAPVAPVGAGPGYNCIGDDYFATQAVLTTPRFVIGDNAGNLYISEYDQPSITSTVTTYGNRIRKVVLSTGKITTIAGSTGTTAPTCGYSGDDGPSTAATLCGPAGMAFTLAGDLIFADAINRRLRKINLVSSPVGRIVAFGGTGGTVSSGNGGPVAGASFRRPFGLISAGDGTMYVGDTVANEVRVIDSSLVINAFVGNGTQGYSGDQGVARDATMWVPSQLALSSDRKLLYIVDTNNDRVRVVGP